MYKLLNSNTTLNKAKLTFIVFFIFLLKSEIYTQDIKELKDSINKYYYSFDIKKLKSLLKDTEKLIATENNNYFAYYYDGIVRYCLGRVIYNIDGDLAYDYFDTALERFEKAYSISKNPVSLAMMSASYGKKSALSPLYAFFFGQKAKNRIYEAFEMDSLNSKILLVGATHLMHIPGIYGGDKEKARQLLYKCLEINKLNKNRHSLELTWADDAEIYAYLAQLDILEGKINSARSFMKKALEIKPKYGFVLIDLENQINSR